MKAIETDLLKSLNLKFRQIHDPLGLPAQKAFLKALILGFDGQTWFLYTLRAIIHHLIRENQNKY